MSDMDHTKNNVFLPAKELRERKPWKKGGLYSLLTHLLSVSDLGSFEHLKYNVSLTFFKSVFL